MSGPISAITIVATMTWMDYPSPVVPTGIILISIMVLTRAKISVREKIAQISYRIMPISLSLLILWSGIWSAWSVIESGITDAGNASVDSNVPSAATTKDDKILPNIYFIVPDRLTNIVGLNELGVDTGEYVDNMNRNGFYVRTDQISIDKITPDSNPVPTTRTFRFMSSILNNGLDIPTNIAYNRASRLVNQSLVFDNLHSIGYEIHNVGSWYTETQTMPKADWNYIYDRHGIMGLMYKNELSMAVIDRSILRYLNVSPVLPSRQHIEIRREEHAFQKDTVESIAETEHRKPVFVMAHLMLPHVPYVWSANGDYPDSSLGPKELYADQVRFTLWYIQDMANRIIASDPDAIILIQSDEGCLFSDAVLNIGASEDVWNGQMISWRIPGAGIDELDNVEPVQLLGWVVDWADGDAD
jgi:hypothetical protein